jgi:hypothetical protein
VTATRAISAILGTRFVWLRFIAGLSSVRGGRGLVVVAQDLKDSLAGSLPTHGADRRARGVGQRSWQASVCCEKAHLWQRSVDHPEDADRDQPRKTKPRRGRMPRSMVENTASTVMPIVRIAIMRAIMYGVSLTSAVRPTTRCA